MLLLLVLLLLIFGVVVLFCRNDSVLVMLIIEVDAVGGDVGVC